MKRTSAVRLLSCLLVLLTVITAQPITALDITALEPSVSSVEYATGYRSTEGDEQLPMYRGYYSELEQVRSASLPSAYDAREDGYVTSVKSQSPYGTCWAFSTVSCMESSLIYNQVEVNGVTATAQNTDLSELQLAYYHYNSEVDPLGLTQGCSVSLNSPGDNFLTVGGGQMAAAMTMFCGYGLTTETAMPYSGGASLISSNLPAADGYDAVAKLKNAYFVNASDTASVKNLILTCGSVTASYYHHDYFLDEYKNSYYCNGAYTSNHAITIVGWNDSYSKNNFYLKPTNNGAWLVKNSWGSSWGDDGYFWMSYEDESLNATNAIGVVAQSADDYDNHYHHDGTSYLGYITPSVYGSSPIYVGNVYTVQGSTRQSLDAVSIALKSTNVDYSVQIYKNPTDSDDPTTGTALLSSPVTGRTTYSGLYQVALDEDVILNPGETFTVVFSLRPTSATSPSTSYLAIYVDGTNTSAENYVHYTYQANSGESFYNRNPSVYYWSDLGSANGGRAARVHAYTSNIESKLTFDANQGTGAPGQITPTQGSVTIPETVPSRIGYLFKGWATAPDASVGQYFPGDTYSGTFPATLYAVWKPFTALQANGSASISDSNLYLVELTQASNIGSFLKNQEAGTLAVLDAENNPLSDTDYVGSGCRVVLYGNGNTELYRCTVILEGDINGNGIWDSNDYINIGMVYLNYSISGTIYQEAIDQNGNGVPDSNDYLIVRHAVAVGVLQRP